MMSGDNEKEDTRPYCPRKAGTYNPRCWEQRCAMWDGKRIQCAYLSNALAKADEVEAARRHQEVMDRYNEQKPVRMVGSGPLY